MTLNEYRKIAPQLNKELEAVLMKHGFLMKRLRASVDEGIGIVKYSIEAADANLKDSTGQPSDPDREFFKRNAPMTFLKVEWLDQVMGGYRIIGLKPRGKKNVLVERIKDGKKFVMPPRAIVTHFAAMGDAEAKANLQYLA